MWNLLFGIWEWEKVNFHGLWIMAWIYRATNVFKKRSWKRRFIFMMTNKKGCLWSKTNFVFQPLLHCETTEMLQFKALSLSQRSAPRRFSLSQSQFHSCWKFGSEVVCFIKFSTCPGTKSCSRPSRNSWIESLLLLSRFCHFLMLFYHRRIRKSHSLTW